MEVKKKEQPLSRLVYIFVMALSLTMSGLALPPPTPKDYWPQWRGPSGQGLASEDNLPTEWSRTKNVAWSTEIPGRGFSSPIVWGDRVFLTTSIEGDVIPGVSAAPHMLGGEPFVHPDAVAGDKRHTLKVIALDTTSGKMLWERTSYEGRVFDARHRVGSFANTTPATDGERVYAWFGSEGLYAYDFSGTDARCGARSERCRRAGRRR